MNANFMRHIIYDYSYFQLFLLVVGYFCLLYFALAPLFLLSCRGLKELGLLHRIVDTDIPQSQISKEIKHSTVSIFIFGLSAIPLFFLIRSGHINLTENTFWHVLFGLFILTVWNEVHFFAVHRLMHLPIFMRKVHYIHHQSKVPTVYAVYSFHWLEAALLSTVPLTILPIINLAALSIFLFPLLSILLNYAGHCNCRFGSGNGASWTLFGTKHQAHHYQFSKNYGFASGLLDKLYQMTISKTNQPNK